MGMWDERLRMLASAHSKAPVFLQAGHKELLSSLPFLPPYPTPPNPIPLN